MDQEILDNVVIYCTFTNWDEWRRNFKLNNCEFKNFISNESSIKFQTNKNEFLMRHILK